MQIWKQNCIPCFLCNSGGIKISAPEYGLNRSLKKILRSKIGEKIVDKEG